jgi:16S rRNA (uracil1498-N3)-methyltransferase
VPAARLGLHALIPAPVPRFFVAGPLAAAARIALPGDAARHVRVLRLRAGDAIVLFDGTGGEFPARIVAAGRAGVEVELGERADIEREPPLAVTLVQGISSGERMDTTIQKAVELGAAAIRPVLAARSQAQLDAARAAARLEHWRRVAIAACEQCGRNRIPPIEPPASLGECCAKLPEGAVRLLLSPRGSARLRDAVPPGTREIVLAAGPEGGFDESEEALLQKAGFITVRLGPRVLRTETAALAALAAVNALAGDF